MAYFDKIKWLSLQSRLIVKPGMATDANVCQISVSAAVFTISLFLFIGFKSD